MLAYGRLVLGKVQWARSARELFVLKMTRRVRKVASVASSLLGSNKSLTQTLRPLESRWRSAMVSNKKSRRCQVIHGCCDSQTEPDQSGDAVGELSLLDIDECIAFCGLQLLRLLNVSHFLAPDVENC